MRSRLPLYARAHPGAVNVATLMGTLLFLFLLAELVLRWTGRHATFNEQYGQEYNSVFNVDQSGWYHIYRPHEIAAQALKEYSYSIRSNNEGLLDKEFSEKHGPDTFRIMVIGDSFIQGMGTSADSTCPRQLERILNQRFAGSPPIEVWNCGISDSDPFFELILFKDRLLKYKPDYVIEAINRTDLSDMIRRGGIGRFNPDSTLTFNHGPWFEPIYQRSYGVRTLVHDILNYNWIFLRPTQQAQADLNSITLIDSALTSFQVICSSAHIPLLVSVQPSRDEFGPGRDYPLSSVIRFCGRVHIPVIDIRDSFEQQGWHSSQSAQLYWPTDGHFNTLGYQIYAQCLSRPLIDYIATHSDAIKNK